MPDISNFITIRWNFIETGYTTTCKSDSLMFQIMPKTQLLDLPNELFFFILQYLSSVEILTAFVGQQSHRIQALIQPFISSLDISKQDDQWIQTYLPEVLSQRRISDLCLQDRQMRFVSRYLPISDVQSIRVLTVGSTGKLSPKDFVEDYRYLKKLSIEPLCITGYEGICRNIF